METCVFSKHLQAYDFTRLGKALSGIGIHGVDLTVRPKGHVEPTEVRTKLPEAAAALGREGVKVTMITTGILSMDEPTTRPVLETAAKLGMKYFKFSYFPYKGYGTIRKALIEANAKLRDVAAFSMELGIWGGYHNHCGETLGATVPHMNRLLDNVDPEGAGVFFDVAHAAMEGAVFGWMQGLDDVSQRVRMIALKDFSIELKPREHYGRVVPMGTGIVQWKEYLPCLKQFASQVGPVSFHGEYDLPADEVVANVARDREFFETMWKTA